VTAVAGQDDALHASLLPLTVATQRGEPSATVLTQPSMPAAPALSPEYRALGVPAESVTPAAIVSTTAEPTPEPSPPPVYIVYTVEEGDTVGGLAARFGIASSSILWNNPQLENGDSLALGEYLRIPMSDGIIYDVGPGDTLSDIADRFGVDVQAIINSSGNNLESADSIAENQTIFIPGGIMPAPVATPTSTPTPAPRPADPPAPAPVPSPPPPDRPSGMPAQAVELARSRIGAPYVSGAAGPNAFDCSGLVFWVYSQLGLDVPRAAPDQFAWAAPVEQSEMEPGDLVFFTNTYPSSQWITHVGIYTGGGMVLMAVDNGDIVREVSLAESYWSAHFAAAGRPH